MNTNRRHPNRDVPDCCTSRHNVEIPARAPYLKTNENDKTDPSPSPKPNYKRKQSKRKTRLIQVWRRQPETAASKTAISHGTCLIARFRLIVGGKNLLKYQMVKTDKTDINGVGGDGGSG